MIVVATARYHVSANFLARVVTPSMCHTRPAGIGPRCTSERRRRDHRFEHLPLDTPRRGPVASRRFLGPKLDGSRSRAGAPAGFEGRRHKSSRAW